MKCHFALCFVRWVWVMIFYPEPVGVGSSDTRWNGVPLGISVVRLFQRKKTGNCLRCKMKTGMESSLQLQMKSKELTSSIPSKRILWHSVQIKHNTHWKYPKIIRSRVIMSDVCCMQNAVLPCFLPKRSAALINFDFDVPLMGFWFFWSSFVCIETCQCLPYPKLGDRKYRPVHYRPP